MNLFGLSFTTPPNFFEQYRRRRSLGQLRPPEVTQKGLHAILANSTNPKVQTVLPSLNVKLPSQVLAKD
jgi:hypothetical protein